MTELLEPESQVGSGILESPKTNGNITLGGYIIPPDLAKLILLDKVLQTTVHIKTKSAKKISIDNSSKI